MVHGGNKAYRHEVGTRIMLFMAFLIILVVSIVVLAAAPRYGADSRRPYDGRRNL